MSNVIYLTADTWDREVVKSDVPTLVDFFANWCGPCRQLAPTIEALAVRYKGRAKVGKVDTDREQELTRRFGISGLPTVLIFRPGASDVEATYVGVRDEQDYVEVIEKLLPLWGYR